MVHRLSPIEKQILKVLLEHDYYLSTREVSIKARISWNTAFNYLKEFHKKDWIAHMRRGNRNYWRAFR